MLILLHAIMPRLGLPGNSEKEMYCHRGKLRTSGASSLLPPTPTVRNQRTDPIHGGRVGLTIDMINYTFPIVLLSLYCPQNMSTSHSMFATDHILDVSIMDIVSVPHRKDETSKPASLILMYSMGKEKSSSFACFEKLPYVNDLLCNALLYAALTRVLSEL